MNSTFVKTKQSLPVLGVGLGYRPAIAAKTLEQREAIDFLEVISDNYINSGALKMQELEKSSHFQKIPHGVQLSIGSTDPIDYAYLDQIKRLIRVINAPWWSDHLCFTSVGKINLHDLCPLPYSREAVRHVASRAKIVQDYVQSPFLLENITAYMRMPGAEMSEAQFTAEVLEQADCGMLLDVNNVYVNAHNHNYDAYEFIDQLPLERVVQIHIAGHRQLEPVWIDSHGAKVIAPVYDLLAYVLQKTKVNAILLERDQFFSKFASILNEIKKIKSVVAGAQPELLSGANDIEIISGAA